MSILDRFILRKPFHQIGLAGSSEVVDVLFGLMNQPIFEKALDRFGYPRRAALRHLSQPGSRRTFTALPAQEQLNFDARRDLL